MKLQHLYYDITTYISYYNIYMILQHLYDTAEEKEAVKRSRGEGISRQT